MHTVDDHTQKLNSSIKRLTLLKQQDVPLICQKTELVRKYVKEVMEECKFTDQLPSVPPLNYLITHKGVVSAMSQCD